MSSGLLTGKMTEAFAEGECLSGEVDVAGSG
jgi:hypothetical protein